MDLSPRLLAIANSVPRGSIVADIGTDHGYLLIYLVKKNLCKFAIGGELNQGPYISASNSVRFEGLTSKIDVRRGNGLEILEPGEVDVVTIAGMGGSTIIEILEGQPRVLKEIKRLVLQPMIGSEQLRKWLVKNNWQLINEQLVKDDGRIYEIITAVPLHPFNHIISPILIEKKDPLLKEHIERLLQADEKILAQLKLSESNEVTAKRDVYEDRINYLRVILCQLNSKQL